MTECVSPPCHGDVHDELCPTCGLKQRATKTGITVDGPISITRRSRDGADQSMIGTSATVGTRVVTVHLRVNDKATRTFDLSALVSIEDV